MKALIFIIIGLAAGFFLARMLYLPVPGDEEEE
jgi:hypothetical protein